MAHEGKSVSDCVGNGVKRVNNKSDSEKDIFASGNSFAAGTVGGSTVLRINASELTLQAIQR